MVNDKIIVGKIKRIQEITDVEVLRCEMYAIFTKLILSREVFKSNNDIKVFLGNFNITFKDYVIGNRTMILARTLRMLEKCDVEVLYNYKKVLNDILFNIKEEKPDNTKIDNAKEDNAKEDNAKEDNTIKYINNILNKYSRNRRGKNEE